MSALPSRKVETFRYADIDALGSIWSDLSKPEIIEIAAQQKLQQIWLPSDADVQVRRVEMTLREGALASIYALNTASRYGRFEIEVTLHNGANFELDAANIGGDEANLEIVTILRHVEPNASSRQTIRSVLGGKAAGSYLGKVAVSRGADGTNSVQSVKAMLLNRGAIANAKPELEIYADDVKCAHGATVGELDREQLFYAAARGLDPASARALLLDGFVGGLWDGIDGDDQGIRELARTTLRAIA